MKDTITIRCSCGGTFEEPAEGIWDKPLSTANSGLHGPHALPGDLHEQVEARLKEREMEANRAALPKPPAYAREEQPQKYAPFEGQHTAWAEPRWAFRTALVSSREVKEAYDALFPAATPEALFAQLREMGVSCEACFFGNNCDRKALSPKADFLCSEWEGK